MLTLLAIIKFLYSHLQRIVHWMRTPHRSHYRSKHVVPTDKHNHCHSPQKPEWLKAEIIRLKALMPQAGCRSIADICNRRFAASRKVTVGKTFVHQILQRHDYEIQILRRNLKHTKPKPVPRNLIWGIDLTGKTDTRGRLHFLFGVIDRKVNDPNTDTVWNSATNWNGGGMHTSNDYGFGDVDARAAVRLAETWQGNHTSYNERHLGSGEGSMNAANDAVFEMRRVG